MIRAFLSRFDFVKSLSNLRRILTGTELFQCLMIVGLTVIGAGLDIILVGLIPATVAVLSDPGQLQKLPLVGGLMPDLAGVSSLTLLKYSTLGILVVGGAKLGFYFVMYWCQLTVGRRIRVRISEKLLETYLAAPWEFHIGASRVELLRNLVTDTRELIIGVVQPMISVIHSFVLTTLILIAMLVTLQGRIIFVFGLIAVSIVVILSLLSNFLRKNGVNAKLQNKVVSRGANEALAHFLEATFYGCRGWFVRRFSQSVDEFSVSQNKLQLVSRLLPSILEFVTLVGVMGLVLVLTLASGSIENILPEITLIAVGAVRLRQSTAILAGSFAAMQFNVPSLQHLSKDLESLKHYPIKLVEKIERSVFDVGLELKSISFEYPNSNAPVLKNVNLTIAPGESIAIVGETGCGKSTLLRMILGLQIPASGQMLLDGKLLHENLGGWQANIGYVPQKICLLDGTIGENIALGVDGGDIDREKMRLAMDASSLRGVVESSPDGLETMIGDDGSMLSGGQRQRIGIARAIYRQPNVFVLDEATSALDEETEMSVMRALESLPWTVTIILVTHRLKAVEALDRVVEVRKGSIVPLPGSYSG